MEVMLMKGKYKVTTDVYNVILNERKLRKADNTPYYEAIKYYVNMEQLLRGLLDMEIRCPELKTLSDVVARIEEVKAMVKLLPKELIRREVAYGQDAIERP